MDLSSILTKNSLKVIKTLLKINLNVTITHKRLLIKKIIYSSKKKITTDIEDVPNKNTTSISHLHISVTLLS